MKYLLTIAIIFLLGISEVVSVGYKLKKQVMGSSVQACSNSSYIVKGTIGQHIVGKVTCSTNKGMYGFWYFDDNLIQLHEISLLKGWNLISTYINPKDDRIISIFDEIKDDIVIVKNNMGQVYIPMYDIDDIGIWNLLEGYQAYTATSSIIVISGNKVKPESTPINMRNGWNIISYLRDLPHDIEDALKTLTDENALVIAKNNEGKVYMPEYDINDIGNMVPGQGYQVYLNKAATLLYPPNSYGKIINSIVYNSPKKLVTQFSNTGNNATLLLKIDTDDGVEIGAFDSKGMLVGSGIVSNNNAVITIWGTDLNPEIGYGAKVGEEIFIKALEPWTESLIDLKLVQIKSILNDQVLPIIKFNTNDVYYAETDFNLNINSLNLNPNPVSNFLNISFAILSPGLTKISLVTMLGVELEIISHKHFETGFYEINFNVEKFSQGVYHIMLENSTTSASKSFVIVK